MIKQIFDEIATESSTNEKMNILSKYKDNELLKRVLYLANSPRVKFYIKQIPEYSRLETHSHPLAGALNGLELLTKRSVTGHEAIKHLREILMCCESDDAYIIERIIEKDCKIGMGTSNINKIFPELIEKTPYMGAKPFTEELARNLFKNGRAVRSDIKMDGRYQNAIIQNGQVQLVTRQGEETPVGDATFLKELAQLSDGVFNGELTIDGEPSRLVANGIIASIVDIEGKRKKRTEAETNKKIANFTKKHGDYQSFVKRIAYTVWDRIEIEEYFLKGSKIKSTVKYDDRRDLLIKIINDSGCKNIRIVESKLVYSYGEAVEHFQEALSSGLEGTILKDIEGVWKDGKDKWQIKMKLEINVDLKIIGFNYGTGKNSEVVSSLTCISECGKLKSKPTGIDEYTMKLIEENQDSLLNTIVEVKSCGISHNSKGEFSMFHPVFKVLRDDKTVADTFEQIKLIENASKLLT